MYQRPKPGETEDDILEMQQRYQQEKETNAEFEPAAKLVTNTNTNRKHKCNAPTLNQDVKQSRTDNQHPEHKPPTIDDNVYFPTILPTVLGPIVEKNVDQAVQTDPFQMDDSNLKTITPRPSLFAQRMLKKKTTEIPKEQEKTLIPEAKVVVPDRSVIVKGEEAMDIHHQNKNLLINMTEEEILAQREQIVSMMNPETVQFVASLRAKDTEEPTIPIFAPEQMNTEKAIDDIPTENEVMSHPNLTEWVNFDTVEEDKLRWMKDVDFKKSIPPDESFEARFDFKGSLLPYSMEYDEESKVLFHHGEEPHRPGYTLNELFQLCRSTVLQQRAVAVNTIAGILECHSMGMYDDVIDVPITKIYFVLRFALDENIPMILEPTLKALRNMFYYRTEECSLDLLLSCNNGLSQPQLVSTKVDMQENEAEESELKDFHLAELDLVNGALRTDILTRINYILRIVKPGFLCAGYCIQILTRFARDSEENAGKLINSHDLIQHIFDEYIPTFIINIDSFKSNSERNKLIKTALKFVRVLISQSKGFAEICVSKYKLLDSILYYMCSGIPETVFMCKIEIESFYVYSCLLEYNIGYDHMNTVTTSLYSYINRKFREIDLMNPSHKALFHFGSAIFTVLTHILNHSQNAYVQMFGDIIVQLAQQLCSEIQRMGAYSAVLIRLASSVFICLESIMKSGNLYLSTPIRAYLLKMMKSAKFEKIMVRLPYDSNMLSGLKMFKNPKGTNIYQLQAISLNPSKEVLPTLRVESLVSFVAALTKYLNAIKDTELSSTFIRNKSVLEYIQQLNISDCSDLNENWYTRIEFEMICGIISLYIGLNVDENEKDLIYALANKLLYILPLSYNRQAMMFLKDIIFNKTWFTTERLMKNLSVSETTEIINRLEIIREFYLSALNLNHDTNPGLLLKNWYQPVLPKDWMYMPILGLYANQSKTDEGTVRHIVRCTLEWILVSEIYFPDITSEIGLTDRFCRLFCVFLCDNSVFLDEGIKPLLQNCIKILCALEKSHLLNFDVPLSGISNFQDLYTQLVEQFQAVSYGDPTFAACVLVPLSNRHNIKWRKLVWSEYAGCLRFLDCPEDMLCYPIESYLSPPETDFSLLKCYHRALNGNLLRAGTVTYRIACNHIELAKQRQIESKNKCM